MPVKPSGKKWSSLSSLVAAICVVLPLQIVFLSDQAGAVQPNLDLLCDRYAAPKSGVAIGSSGVSFDQLDAEMAVPACEAAVEQDQANSHLQYQLGRAYEKAGKLNAALDRYRQAAAAGYPAAFSALGYLYSIGRGVEQNDRTAFDWFRKGAEAGDVVGQFTLGQIYENGRGVALDTSEALKWYRKAADQGLAEGQDSVGYFYSVGAGVTRNDAEAVIWMRKAAEQGFVISQYNLGLMYEKGRGVAADRFAALSWYKRAAGAGNTKAEEAIIRLTQVSGDPQKRALGARPNTEIETNSKQTLARGLGNVAGAIVCPDLQTVKMMYDQYNRHWEESMQDKLTHGQAQLIRGSATPEPDLPANRCVLVPAGTPMTLESSGPIPIVSVQLPGNKSARGVTLPLMAGGGNTPGLLGVRN